MGEEFINGEDRWCLWMTDLDPADVARSPVLRKRLEGVRTMRLKSTASSTRKMAETPHLFGQRSQPTIPYLGIPKVFSERRRWATAARMPADVIAGDKVYKVDDPDGFAFAVMSSSMFIVWQKSVGGRWKSDPSFSNTLVWNTLPLPKVTESVRRAICAAGQKVLDARDLHLGRSLEDLYNPLAMDPVLVSAHSALDRVVDKAFGARRAVETEADRQRVLFQRYEEMTTAGQL